MQKTLLAIGAHYDDCVYGVPGIMLQAVRKHYRVVQLILIGDYSNWPPAKERSAELRQGCIEINKEYGCETRFLDFASMRFEVNLETKRAVAAAVAEIKPDVALHLWPDDHHHDHEVAAVLAQVALRHGGRVLDDGANIHRPSKIFCYDNGPRHTIGFEPDTFVDVSDEWPAAIDWLGKFMALVRQQPYNADQRDSAQQAKETLAKYRGMTVGAKYAEALWSANKHPQEIL